MNFLDFEQPVAELEAKIKELRYVSNDRDLNINEEINKLQKRSAELIKTIFSSLSAWQISQVARHPQRPHTLDYITRIITDFEELHGDRNIADDPAIICGMGRLENRPVAIIGHQKGRDTNDRIYRNYGMPRPEGYRKALRIMQLAERFQLPLLTFIDTPGAHPGIDAEERGQSEAIAKNLLVMSELKTPIIAAVIGEGGSGGALAIGVADLVFMLQYSIYSVISPEGCASILWKNADKAEDAAEALGITAPRLKQLELIDGIVDEPPGGAHRDYDAVARTLKQTLLDGLESLSQNSPDSPDSPKSIDQLVIQRRRKLRDIGRYKTA